MKEMVSPSEALSYYDFIHHSSPVPLIHKLVLFAALD